MTTIFLSCCIVFLSVTIIYMGSAMVKLRSQNRIQQQQLQHFDEYTDTLFNEEDMYEAYKRGIYDRIAQQHAMEFSQADSMELDPPSVKFKRFLKTRFREA